jgi:aldose 1-epimerase
MTTSQQISSSPWGTLPSGDTVTRYILRNAQDMQICVLDYGGALQSWLAPDRTGRLADVVLGHPQAADYALTRTFMGALVGRWANRIAGARFMLDGVSHAVDNNEGDNLLHGGWHGFDCVFWEVAEADGGLALRYESPEGEGGFPGKVTVDVSYRLADDGTLTIDYEALTDAPTPLNLTNHTFFNLSGPHTDIRGHVLSIDAERFLEIDAASIPTGVAEVAGRPFDFRTPAPIGTRLDWPNAQLALAGGFDHCFVLRGNDDEMRVLRPVASLYEPGSGRELTVSTTEAGLQFYTGNHIAGQPGKGGAIYRKHDGLALEAGAFPNRINMPDPEAVVLRPGGRYRQVTQYRVGVRAQGG